MLSSALCDPKNAKFRVLKVVSETLDDQDDDISFQVERSPGPPYIEGSVADIRGGLPLRKRSAETIDVGVAVHEKRRGRLQIRRQACPDTQGRSVMVRIQALEQGKRGRDYGCRSFEG